MSRECISLPNVNPTACSRLSCNIAPWKKKCFGERWYLCVTRHSIVRQQWWQGKSHLKNHLYICLHPSKEIDLEWKVKYLPNLMSDIVEKKNNHYINETLQLKKEIEILLLSWPLSPWTLTLNAWTRNCVQCHVSKFDIKNQCRFDLLFFGRNPKLINALYPWVPLARLQKLAFGRRGTILHAVEFDFRAKSEVFHATSDIISSPKIVNWRDNAGNFRQAFPFFMGWRRFPSNTRE